MALDTLGEFGLIDEIRRRFASPNGMTGIGDDCAIIPQQSGLDTLVSTDLIVEDIHFLRSDMRPYDIGWRSAAVNISDIAAMGGTPFATFLSVALPQSVDHEWITQFIDGYQAISQQYNVALLGGDTTSSPDKIVVNVGVLGTAPHGTAKRRDTAQEGDWVCVTGALGDAAAGLHIILNNHERDNDIARQLLAHHYRPTPQVEAGLALARMPEVHAMMDISDGVASDLRHILEASHVGAFVDLDSIPLSPALRSYAAQHSLDALQLALAGGEDFELLFTMAPNTPLATPYYKIGTITQGNDLQWSDPSRNFKGFTHF